MSKPKLLFFARQWYCILYPQLQSDAFDADFAVMNREEKLVVQKRGGNVVGCFEEEYDQLPVAGFPSTYLRTSFYADRLQWVADIKKRREVLGKMISFWRSIMEKGGYYGCVHETVAIQVDEVLSQTAKEFGIQDFNYINSILNAHFFWKSSPYHSGFTQERLDATTPSEEDYERAREYIQVAKEKGHKPYYTQFSLQKFKTDQNAKIPYWRLMASWFKNELKNLGKPNFIAPDEDEIKRAIFNYNWPKVPDWIIKEGVKSDYTPKRVLPQIFFDQWIDFLYQNLYNYDDLNKYSDLNLVLYPMHVEPEATLLYFSPEYSEQDMVIQEIAKNLPLDHVLVVKEHPEQAGFLLKKKFVELRNRNSNIVYVPGKFDSHQLLKQIRAVITIHGSVGWEGIVNNIPTIALGNVYYDKHPSLIKPKSYYDLYEILGQEKLPVASDEETLEYSAKLVANSYPGMPNHRSKIFEEQNVNDIRQSLVTEMQKRMSGEK